MERVAQELEAHLNENSGIDKTYRRNAALAMLEFAFTIKLESIQNEEIKDCLGLKSPNKFPACVVPLGLHLYRYGHTASAFDDIKNFVERLSLEEQKAFLLLNPYFLSRRLYRVATAEGDVTLQDFILREKSKRHTNPSMRHSKPEVSRYPLYYPKDYPC